MGDHRNGGAAERLTIVEQRSEGALPAEVHALLVASLFKDRRSLVFGGVTTAIAIAVTAVRTGVTSLWPCAGLLVIVVVARLILMRRYHARASLGLRPDSLSGWERSYGFGAALHCLVIGLWCFLCLTRSNDAFAHLLSAVVTVGCASAIPGRNFGRTGIATVQAVSLSAPLCLGWMAKGDPWYAALALLSLPFFASLRTMSVRLQALLLDALTANNKLGTLAARFDAALSNMPLGICMLDDRKRVQVSNARLMAVLGLGASDLTGATLPALPCHVLGEEQAAGRIATDRVEALLDTHAPGDLTLQTDDGRTVQLTLQPMANGGAVLLAEDVTRRRQAEAHILTLARYDTVTSVANRSYFVQQAKAYLEASHDAGSLCALLFLDLDRFKMVNDTLGHAAGDLLLQDVARRLQRLVGATDLVGRFGGDEFLVLQTNLASAVEAERLADAIVAGLCRPFLLSGESVRVAASVGLVVVSETEADIDVMLQQADMALYRAKSAGRGRWIRYDASMDAAALQRHVLELELGAAIESWAFEIHYQPLFRFDEKRIRTCEALLRWNHPKHGMIPPAQFIPIAEETGLIAELGAKVLMAACEECRNWPPLMNVAVNLSPVQFQRGDVVAMIRDALDRSGLQPHRLEVEITESVLLQDTPTVRDALQRIGDMGVHVVLDDFGTGHSSLAYLHSFPLEKVKLDRSFLATGGDRARSQMLLEGVCGLSRKLGLTVVVEGVETEAQLSLVRDFCGADEVQGYHIGRPVPRREIRALLWEDDAAGKATDAAEPTAMLPAA